jgi:hypothetical protein
MHAVGGALRRRDSDMRRARSRFRLGFLLGAWGKGARELRRENEVWLAASGAPRGKKNCFLASCSSTCAFVRSHSPASQPGLSLRWSRSDPKKLIGKTTPKEKGKGERRGNSARQLNARAVFFSREPEVEGCARRKRPGRGRFLGPAQRTGRGSIRLGGVWWSLLQNGYDPLFGSWEAHGSTLTSSEQGTKVG